MEISAGGKTISGCYCPDCARNNPEIKVIFETFQRNRISFKQKSCPFCGTTLEEWKQSRVAGCASCYQTFRSYIKKEIKKYHYGSFHRGKIPHSENINRDLLLYFENEMRRAVAEQDIELVKKIKKEIEVFIGNG
ncbi:MAG: hypothetical protein ACP5JO_04015 [Candidatus Ratteibacteria bacterium]